MEITFFMGRDAFACVRVESLEESDHSDPESLTLDLQQRVSHNQGFEISCL